MRRHRERRVPLTPFVLTAEQLRLVDLTAGAIPAVQRQRFRCEVVAKLKLTSAIGAVPDELLQRCIDAALIDIESEDAA